MRYNKAGFPILKAKIAFPLEAILLKLGRIESWCFICIAVGFLSSEKKTISPLEPA